MPWSPIDSGITRADEIFDLLFARIISVKVEFYELNQELTRNATRCNNHDDFAPSYRHIENFNNFLGLHIIQWNIYDGDFIAKLVSC